MITLLEILYQAEVERIVLTEQKAQQAVASAASFTPEQVDSDQQAFADAASDSATYLNHLAQFLSQRASGEESSHHEELNATAQTLLGLADDLINQANECMDEPEDAEDRKSVV